MKSTTEITGSTVEAWLHILENIGTLIEDLESNHPELISIEDRQAFIEQHILKRYGDNYPQDCAELVVLFQLLCDLGTESRRRNLKCEVLRLPDPTTGEALSRLSSKMSSARFKKLEIKKS